jgi:sugar-specific transcriptional regulator TrmB
MDKEIFYQLGLNEKETEIYLCLLRQKESSATEISKLTKVNRTTVYLEIGKLIQKGLISSVTKDSKKYFRALNPEIFLEQLDEKKENFKSILPNLRELKKLDMMPSFEMYQGKEVIKTLYSDILKTNSEVLLLGATGYAFDILKYSFPQFYKKALNSNIKARYLANYDTKDIFKNYPKDKVRLKYLKKEHFSEVSTILYNNKVVIQSLKVDKIYAILIEDKNLFDTYKNYFEFIWNLLK